MLHSGLIPSETMRDYAEGFNGPQSDESLVRRKEAAAAASQPFSDGKLSVMWSKD